jgi:hypothetical protein
VVSVGPAIGDRQLMDSLFATLWTLYLITYCQESVINKYAPLTMKSLRSTAEIGISSLAGAEVAR